MLCRTIPLRGEWGVKYAFWKMLIPSKIDGHHSKCIVFILNF